MKNIVLLLILFAFGGCNPSSDRNVPDKGIEEIVIDPDKFEEYLDLSEILDESIDIIPLETTEECLMSEINQIEFYKDKIYISDNTYTKIFVFSTTGRFLHSIGRLGTGPGEYSYLRSFTLRNDSIVIQDHYLRKFFIYDLYGNWHRDIPYNVTHSEIVSFDDTGYLIANYSDSDYGNFNLFKYDFRTSNVVSSEIPFDNSQIDKSGYALRRYSSKYNDAATLIYPLNDTIYTLKKDTMYPSYAVHFTSRNLPDKLDVDRDDLFRYVRRNKYLKGFEYLQNSQEYLLGYYVDGASFRFFVYNKQSADIRIGEQLNIGLFGSMTFHHFYTTANGELYISQPASSLSLIWNYRRTYCTNSYYREKIDSIVERLDDDSNPVLFRCNFRKRDE